MNIACVRLKRNLTHAHPSTWNILPIKIIRVQPVCRSEIKKRPGPIWPPAIVSRSDYLAARRRFPFLTESLHGGYRLFQIISERAGRGRKLGMCILRYTRAWKTHIFHALLMIPSLASPPAIVRASVKGGASSSCHPRARGEGKNSGITTAECSNIPRAPRDARRNVPALVCGFLFDGLAALCFRGRKTERERRRKTATRTGEFSGAASLVSRGWIDRNFRGEMGVEVFPEPRLEAVI